MNLCDTCIYRNENEYHKPCIVYRDDCEHYEKEGDMTREEAIKELQESHDIMRSYDIDESESRLMTALDMAIKALEQEPCDVAINRQAVLKTLDDMDNVLDEDRTIENYKELLKECYEVLPSVTPQEPKTGHWIRQDNTKEPLYGWYFCSECNSVIGDKTKFCSNCGARMVEPQERIGEE